jgi:N-acetylmuramoyl-L-alanine amidase
MTTNTIRAVIVLALATILQAGVLHAQTRGTPPSRVEALYADAAAGERAVHAALAAPDAPETILKAVRTVVADFENVVRRFPSSGYSDDALWYAARVSSIAFERFGDQRERKTAIRLLQELTARYPSSKFVKQVPQQLAALEDRGRPLPDALAPLEGPRRDRSGAVTPVEVAFGQKNPRRDRPAPKPADAAVPPPISSAPSQPAKLATIKAIRRAALTDAVRIVIELDGEVSFHDERLEDPPRIFVDLPSTRTDAALTDKTIRFDGADGDIVRQVRVGRHPGRVTRVVLDTGGVSSYSVYPLYNPYRLIIDCLREQPSGTKSQSARLGSVGAISPAAATATTPVAATVPPAVARSGSAPGTAPGPAQGTASGSALATVPAPPPPPTLRIRRIVPSWTTALPVVNPSAAAQLAEARTALEAPPAQAAAATMPTVAAPPPSSAPTGPTPPSPDSASRNLAGGLSLARQLGLGVSRIVIDPGHGGHDPGAKGSGVTEAELVLDIAIRLETLLSQIPGTEVVLTRREDEFVPLQERTAIANRETADLFLSIHANANSSVHVSGIETYYLNFASNLSAAAVAARENAASGQAMGALPDVVKSIALHNKIDESKDFATIVQRSMMSKLAGTNKTAKDLGVKQAPFVVLIGAAMPSVLTEISFLTNAQESRLLKRSAYRQKIAEALFEAIRKYQTSLKHSTSAAQ